MGIQVMIGSNNVTKQVSGATKTVGVILSFNNSATLPAFDYNPCCNSMELMISLPIPGSSPIAAEVKPFLDLDTLTLTKTGTLANIISNCGGSASIKTVVGWYAQNVLGLSAGAKAGVDFVVYRLDTTYRYDTTTSGAWTCLAWDKIENPAPSNNAYLAKKLGSPAGVVLGSLRKDTLSASGWTLSEFEEIYLTATATTGGWPYLTFPLPIPATPADLTFSSYTPGTGWAVASKALAPAASQMGMSTYKDISQMIHGSVVSAELTDAQVGSAMWPLWTPAKPPQHWTMLPSGASDGATKIGDFDSFVQSNQGNESPC
ncbi:MAG: hypothetical protein ACI81R_002822 [Bradymonadia bacterium]|jgi:hypothetical protein